MTGRDVEGEVIHVRPAPRSPLDPDGDGGYPTALRPTPTELLPRGGELARRPSRWRRLRDRWAR